MSVIFENPLLNDTVRVMCTRGYFQSSHYFWLSYLRIQSTFSRFSLQCVNEFGGYTTLWTVAKQLPGDLVDWLQSGEGVYLLLKVFATFAVIALFCGRVLPILQKGLNSLKARVKGNDISLEPRSVNVNSKLMILNLLLGVESSHRS